MLRKFLDAQTRGSEKIRGALKICILQNQQEWGGSSKIEPLARGTAKLSSFEFQYLHPLLVILNELSLRKKILEKLAAPPTI